MLLNLKFKLNFRTKSGKKKSTTSPNNEKEMLAKYLHKYFTRLMRKSGLEKVTCIVRQDWSRGL